MNRAEGTDWRLRQTTLRTQLLNLNSRAPQPFAELPVGELRGLAARGAGEVGVRAGEEEQGGGDAHRGIVKQNGEEACSSSWVFRF